MLNPKHRETAVASLMTYQSSPGCMLFRLGFSCAVYERCIIQISTVYSRPLLLVQDQASVDWGWGFVILVVWFGA